MKEVQIEKATNIEAVLKECRSKGVTIEDLLNVISTAIASKEAVGKGDIGVTEKENIEIRVSNLLREIGIPSHIKGYQYVRYAIIYSFENPEAMDGVTKVVYPNVAKKFATTSSRVERAIRHAIEVAWERGESHVFDRYFGNTIDLKRGKPTNSEFIAMLVDYLKLN